MFNEARVQTAVEEVRQWWNEVAEWGSGPGLDDLITIHRDEYISEAVEMLENWVSNELWAELTAGDCVEVIRRTRTEVLPMTERDFQVRLLERVEQILRYGSAEDRARIRQIIVDTENGRPASSSIGGGSSSTVG